LDAACSDRLKRSGRNDPRPQSVSYQCGGELESNLLSPRKIIEPLNRRDAALALMDLESRRSGWEFPELRSHFGPRNRRTQRRARQRLKCARVVAALERARVSKGARPSGCRDVLNSRTPRSNRALNDRRAFLQPEGRLKAALLLTLV